MKYYNDRLKHTINFIGASEDYFRFLSRPQRTVIVNFPVRMDDGHIQMFEGYRVLHSNVLGPGKGGLRICPDVNLSDLSALAQLMTWKCSLIGLPLGGSKGAIKADPKTLSKGEMERMVRKYTGSMMNVIGPKKDIPSPDLNTNAQTMAWMMDAYSMGVGRTTPSVVTGKPVEIGGIQGRNRAVGLGMNYLFEEYTRKEAEDIKGKKVVIQGFGHVGKNVAKAASFSGAHIVGISDSTTGLYNPEGLDINEILKHKREEGSLLGYSRAEKISNEKMLELECDVLFPCATQDQITSKNADKLNCQLIIEGANAPTTISADKILNERGISVIPDILANAGGVIVSYFEWVQDLSALQWTMDKVSKELQKIILGAFNEVYRYKQDNVVSYRQAAHILAVERVIKAVTYRGIYP
jgi:glutamate dehydrogenase (NAD(P)+)